MLNSIAIQGRLVHTPEAKVTKSGTDVCQFDIACDRVEKGEKKTDFFRCIAFGKTAQFIPQYFQKGSMILVSGSIQTRKFQDKQGNNRVATEIMANKVDFAGNKSETPSFDQQTAEHVREAKGEDDFRVIDDSGDDLPFD